MPFFLQMVRNYIRKTIPRPATYSQEGLSEAVRRVKEGEPCRKVARLMNIPHRTLRDHVAGTRKMRNVGRPRALLEEEELSIAQHIATFGDFGYAFDMMELRLFVKSFLDKANRHCAYFENNMPGVEWGMGFVERHKELLSMRMCQNISRKRAAISVEKLNSFFDNLENTVSGVPPQNIINYDETNLTDDPKSKLMIYRKGIKRAERVLNVSKSSVSLMFACSADGKFLPPYVVYKAERLMDTWVMGGPIGTRYNRTKSGWFDGYCFKDWLQRQAVPYFNNLQNDAPRVLIGDNLSSHLSADIIEICEVNNIKMIFLPPNSTHLLQPLDVAIYGPMKAAWRKVLTQWKQREGKYYTTLPKPQFPRLLFDLLNSEGMKNKKQYAVSGFKTTGLFPVNRTRVICKLTKNDMSPSHSLVSPMLMAKLRELREASDKRTGLSRRGRAINISPGKSVSQVGITNTAGPSGVGRRTQSTKRKLHLVDESEDDDESPDIEEEDNSSNKPDSEDEDDDDNDSPYSEGEEEMKEMSKKEREEVHQTEVEDEPEPREKKEEACGELEVHEGMYVVIRFEGKKPNSQFHYVGKVLGRQEGGKVPIKYLRRDCSVICETHYYFKDPPNPDIMTTDMSNVIKALCKPTLIKSRICYPSREFKEFHNMR